MLEESIAFLLGFFSLFSPCVLPILPIVFSVSRMRIIDSLAIFFGLISSFFLLNMFSVFLLPFKILGYILLFFLSIYLLYNKIEIYLSRKISIFYTLLHLRLPPLVYGFFLSFLWLPCIGPFLGLAISEAIITKKPLVISLSFITGIASSISLLLFVGKKVKINLEKFRKSLGITVFIAAVYFVAMDTL